MTRVPSGTFEQHHRRGSAALAAAGVLAAACFCFPPATGAVAAAAPQAEPDRPKLTPRDVEPPKRRAEGPGDAGDLRPDPDKRPEAAQKEKPEAGGGAGKPQENDPKAAAASEKPPEVPLPSQGVYAASELARLAGAITGRSVQIGDTGVERRRIEVVPLLAGQAVTLDELKLLLAFHGIYLFDAIDPKEGAVLVATTDPRWHPRQARYTQVLEVSALGFKRVWSRLKAAIDEHNAANAARPQPEAEVAGVPVESVGKIFLRAPNRKTLAGLIELAQSVEAEKPPAHRMRMFAYTGRYRLVRDLEQEVVEQLSEGERSKARFVVMRTGNRLLYRAPAQLGERIMDLLERADTR